MLVAIGYCTKDQDQAERLAAWMAELGPYPTHRLLVARDVRAKENVFARAGFASVDEIVITDDAWNTWPQSCNNVFRKVGKHIEFGTKEPFLWIEADVAPMRAGWLDAIAAEYAGCGKPFMGDRVEVEGVPLHMSGVGVYPGILSARAGLCYLAQEIAWDCMAAEQIVPQAHFTKLIEHAWKHPTFESWEQVEAEIAPETVLYHASKDGSLIRLLRERAQLVKSWEAAGAGTVFAMPEKIEARASGSSPIVCDIFIKTYPPDYPWLEYCIRSVARFATGIRRVVTVSPEDDASREDGVRASIIRSKLLDVVGARVLERPEYGEDGYLSQQVFKLYSDTLTDASHILFLDSDTIFTRPVTPETYFKDHKIVWMMTPWEKTNTPWRPIVEKFMGQPVEFEFMRRHPTVVPRWLLSDVREFCLKQHGMPLDQYVMSQPHRAFSEFNVLGAFAYAFHRDQFHWVNTEEVPPDEWPELTVKQGFSWGGLTDEVKAEFEKILGESNEPEPVPIGGTGAHGVKCTCVEHAFPCPFHFRDNEFIAWPSTILPPHALHECRWLNCPQHTGPLSSESHANGAPLLATLPPQTPWESKEQSLEEIRGLAGRLKNFCGKASHVRAVRLELHKLGVIELPYRFKRRKGKWRGKKK